MPSSKIKELLKYPGSWVLILSIIIFNIIEIIIGKEQSIPLAIIFGIFSYFIDLFIVNRSRELFGLKKIKLLNLMWITFIGCLKLSMLPIIFLIIASTFLSSKFGWNLGIADIESNSFRTSLAFALYGVWISFGINFIIFTSSTKNLISRIYRMLKSTYKVILPLIMLYMTTLVIFGLLKKIEIWSNASYVVIQIIAVFIYRLWFFEIFSNSKIPPPINTNDMKLEAESEI